MSTAKNAFLGAMYHLQDKSLLCDRVNDETGTLPLSSSAAPGSGTKTGSPGIHPSSFQVTTSLFFKSSFVNCTTQRVSVLVHSALVSDGDRTILQLLLFFLAGLYLGYICTVSKICSA